LQLRYVGPSEETLEALKTALPDLKIVTD